MDFNWKIDSKRNCRLLVKPVDWLTQESRVRYWNFSLINKIASPRNSAVPILNCSNKRANPLDLNVLLAVLIMRYKIISTWKVSTEQTFLLFISVIKKSFIGGKKGWNERNYVMRCSLFVLNLISYLTARKMYNFIIILFSVLIFRKWSICIVFRIFFFKFSLSNQTVC